MLFVYTYALPEFLEEAAVENAPIVAIPDRLDDHQYLATLRPEHLGQLLSSLSLPMLFTKVLEPIRSFNHQTTMALEKAHAKHDLLILIGKSGVLNRKFFDPHNMRYLYEFVNPSHYVPWKSDAAVVDLIVLGVFKMVEEAGLINAVLKDHEYELRNFRTGEVEVQVRPNGLLLAASTVNIAKYLVQHGMDPRRAALGLSGMETPQEFALAQGQSDLALYYLDSCEETGPKDLAAAITGLKSNLVNAVLGKLGMVSLESVKLPLFDSEVCDRQGTVFQKAVTALYANVRRIETMPRFQMITTFEDDFEELKKEFVATVKLVLQATPSINLEKEIEEIDFQVVNPHPPNG